MREYPPPCSGKLHNWCRQRILAIRHKFHRLRLKREFGRKTPVPTILSSDCIGGVMSHELGLPFRSPTVNLYFETQEGFFAYVEHLQYYVSVIPECCAPGYNAGRAYPIGVLRGDGDLPDVRLHFLHYRTFDEACAAWIRRSARIDWGNICVVMYADVPEESELVDRFAALPYARKVLLSCTRMNRPFVFTYDFPFLPLEEPVPGLMLLYDGISGRRLLDHFDYPAFLRDGTIRAAQ